MSGVEGPLRGDVDKDQKALSFVGHGKEFKFFSFANGGFWRGSNMI